MSDGVIRFCREHDMELRQLGAHLVCPLGHTCDVDWYVKQAATRVVPSLPIPVVEEPIERKPKEKTMATAMDQSKPKRRSPGQLAPHGTPQRYFQEVKGDGKTCEPCRKAASAYAKARRLARLAAAGQQPSTRATKSSPVRKPKSVQQKPAKILRSKALVVPRSPAEWLGSPAGADLENKVLRLRADLAEAEQAYLSHVQKLIPGLVLSR
jgi:hypothetical protein